ncbi:MAG: hypothetical protein ACO3U4_06955, partial [Gemmobacter sp.]
MAAQSRPAILITRPAEGGARFARALRRRLGPGLRIICAPLMAPRWLSPVLPALLGGGGPRRACSAPRRGWRVSRGSGP